MPGRLSDTDTGHWTSDTRDSRRDLFPDAPDRLHTIYDMDYDVCKLILQEDGREDEVGKDGECSFIPIRSESPLPHLPDLLKKVQRRSLQLVLHLDVPDQLRRLRGRLRLALGITPSWCA